jgi:hypothetical protein
MSKTKPKGRRWKYTQPDIEKQCFICDNTFQIKYILPKKKYSQKNNWGYWTGKKVFQDKYACDGCLVNIHKGGIINWASDLEKADIFYTYLSRGNFQER